MTFHVVDLIRTKRDGGRLPDAAVDWLISSYTAGAVPDEQMASYLMAVVWRGMRPAELSRWTAAMVASGERLDLSGLGRPTVDKHSTGGVGDKVSLVLVPLVVACGAAVPQLAGRGLGHTGGTLDKMAAISGWRASLAPERMRSVLTDVGGVIAAAGAGLAPADRKLYALRDVTGTVESIPLIASSIMSKKIAEGTSALVLDVKVGSGAFMTAQAPARELAETMVTLGDAAGVRTEALLTGMDTPLGRTAGNALEVDEAVAALRGGGPADLVEVTVALARRMLTLAGLAGGPDPADVLAAGRAHDVWQRMVTAQGGDPDAPLPVARHVETLPAPATGFLRRLDARAVGLAAWRLGAGRARQDDEVSAVAGVRWFAGPGERVVAGAPLLELHTDDPARLATARAALADAVEIADTPQSVQPLVLAHVHL
ncbi:thymidine phosphorylase [Protofrankia sp. BMG5.30]|uniref:thymidine phosphorylase n=1 Tax=Protofrankia sp. BMG5.30 TaxID=1834514 RepID=UPI0009768DAC|nr:thymidine phosphorylase [Protofrankia sp. BMG5.30]ONH38421.1 thymidine phosphorylase [Protofrankia sp. BMG5.30]